jgi:hypothetical protein
MVYILRSLKCITPDGEFHNFLKKYPTQDICYMYYNIRHFKILYIGSTTQHGFKKISYLKNHHIMKNINDNFDKYIHIYIYIKYSENFLIKLFKPILNKQGGSLMKKYRNEVNIFEIPYFIKYKYFDTLSCYKLDLFDKLSSSSRPSHCSLLKIWGFDNIINIGINFGINYLDEYNWLYFQNLNIKFRENKPLYISAILYKNDKQFITSINKNVIKCFAYNYNILTSDKLLSILCYCNIEYYKECISIIINCYIVFLEENIKKNNIKCSCGKIYKTPNGLYNHLRIHKCNICRNEIQYIVGYHSNIILCNTILVSLITKKYLLQNWVSKPQIWGRYVDNIMDVEHYLKFKKRLNFVDEIGKNKYKINFVNIKELSIQY